MNDSPTPESLDPKIQEVPKKECVEVRGQQNIKVTQKEKAGDGESSSEEDEGYYWRRASNPEYPRFGRQEL